MLIADSLEMYAVKPPAKYRGNPGGWANFFQINADRSAEATVSIESNPSSAAVLFQKGLRFDPESRVCHALSDENGRKPAEM